MLNMTQVNIVDATQNTQVRISDAKDRNWYKVVGYAHNKELVGRIGILIPVEIYEAEIAELLSRKILVTTSGEKFDHEDFILQPISKITISVE